MSNEADSRHTVSLPRWGETVAQVPDAGGVVEPSGGVKDVGWSLGVPPNRQWWNWLHWATGVFFRYIENSRALMWTKNALMAGAAAGEGAVSAGVGLSVNVASARVWIDGKMQKVPAVTNLALATAHATLERKDLVIASVVSLAPVYSVVTGTPAGPPVAPAVPAGSVPLAEVSVVALGVAPALFVDRREFGAIDLSLAKFTSRLIAGTMTGSDFMLEVMKYQITGWALYIGGISDPIFEVTELGPRIKVKADAFQFFDPLTREYRMQAIAFQKIADAGGMLGPSFSGGVNDWTASPTALPASTGAVAGQARLPHGATITDVRVRGTKGTDTAAGLTVRLLAINRITGVVTTTFGPVDNEGGPIGDFTLSITGIAHVTLSASDYVLVVEFESGANAISLNSAEIEYTETHPFEAA